MNPVLWFLLAFGVAELYERKTSPEFKQNWHDSVKMHHGEAGVLAALGGIALKSPGLVSTGLALALHDHKDKNKWFRK